MRSDFQKRLRIISFLIVFFALVLASKLYLVQIVNGREFAENADRQYIKSDSDVYKRGSIFFTEKDGGLISAATLKSGFIIAMNPGLIKDASLAYEKINAVVEIPREEFMFKVGKKDDPYEILTDKATEGVAEGIEALQIEGLHAYKEQWRYYPGDELASRAIGFVGWSDDKFTGLYGLEKYYDDILRRDESNVYSNFFTELFLNIGGILKEDGAGREGDIVTTIEPAVQSFLEKKIEEVNTLWQSKVAGGIIMDPNNGEIFAIAIDPTYNLNTREVKDASVFNNPIVENVYEMGSIIKPLSMAAGLDAGVVSAETTYNDAGYIILNSSRISNYDKRGRGVVSMQEVLNQSLNTGVAFVVSKLGNQKFAEYMLNYGIEEETGIDLPGETHGLADNLNSPRDVEYATASFGQGIAMTPIETIRALASLGNGGYLTTPHLVKKINYKLGDSKDLYQNENRQVLKKETSEEITRMLVEVVDDALLGGSVKQENYSIAAKTGTAQIADQQNGGYYEDRFLHSFFGYFPAYSPRFIVFLYTLEPQGRYASETLTHPFMDIAKFLLNYYEIPPDR